ncbi:PAC2 family protein [Nocardioides limicola]|uniref:PAC2 family protein n=1 Tax=Nocardioides limicola TaxID=2803368 RepID=UPI0027DB2B94|nr:PAC2 family protein [Nocardioides sp. DJM-14]
MSKPRKLVHIIDELAEVDPTRRPVLVMALDGFLDAGHAGQLAAGHLWDNDPVIATFEVDEFYDYRARRPPITFMRDHYQGYETPRLVVRSVVDAAGTSYLLMTGPEPDNKWEAFAGAVRHLVERLGVRLVVSMGSVPMAVPHTRPIAITPHANDPSLLTGPSRWQGELRVPSSAQAMLEIRLGEWGHPAQGFVAHVPHYIAHIDYQKAAVALLEQVSGATGLRFDLTGLEADAADTEAEIARYLAANVEVSEVVAGLEQQYDSFAEAEEAGHSLLAEDRPLPTGEEIGHQFEQFLAGLDRPDGEQS